MSRILCPFVLRLHPNVEKWICVCKYIFDWMHLYVCWMHLYVSGNVLSGFVCNFVTNSLQTLDTKMKYISYTLIIYTYAFICILSYTLVHSYESEQVNPTYM